MKNLLLFVIIFIQLNLFSQPNWSFSNTGDNHTIIIQNTIPIIIDGVQITSGDYIGVFYDSLGTLKCAGYIEWNGFSNNIAAWGEDVGNDGFQSGEAFKWKFWRQSDSQIFDATATYQTGQFYVGGNYVINGISALASLQSVPSVNGADISISALVNPQSQCYPGYTGVISYSVQNLGNQAQNSFMAYYQINSGAVKSLNFQSTLNAGQSSTISFIQLEDFTNVGNYNIICWVSASGDVNTANDTVVFDIETFDNPIVNLGQDANVAEGSAFTIDAGIFSTYLWNTGESTQTIDVSQSGIYTVTVTDNNLCQDIDDVTITFFSSSPNWNYNQTVDNHIILIPDTCQISINGNNVQVGDYIGVFYDSLGTQKCGGYIIWNGLSTTIAAWGEDAGNDGFSTGESFSWRIWRISDGQEYEVSATYNTSSIFSNLGEYQANGISGIVSLTTTSAFSLDLIGQDVDCFGNQDGEISSIVSGGQQPIAYSWSNGSTSSSISALISGWYFLTIQDAIGNILIDSVEITEPQALNYSEVLEHNLCYGDSIGSISGNVTGGTGPYTFLWNTGENSQSIFELTAANYNLLITDSKNCQLTRNFSILQADEIDIALNAQNITCNGLSNGSVEVVTQGGVSPYEIIWNNSESGSVISNLNSGNYSVTIEDAYSCIKTDSIFISEPDDIEIQFVLTSPTCSYSEDGEILSIVTGGTSPYLFSWSNGQSGDGIQGIDGGNYSLIVFDNNTCLKIADIVLSEPEEINANFSIENISCNTYNDGSITVSPSGGTSPNYSLVWSNGSTDTYLENLSSGYYYLTITDSNTCLYEDSVFIDEPDLLIVEALSTDISCNGAGDGEIQLNINGGTAPYHYSWSVGQTSQNISALEAGIYAVIVSDNNSCFAVQISQIFEPDEIDIQLIANDPSVYGGNDGNIQSLVAGGNSPYSFLWSTGESTPGLENINSGWYFLTINDANACFMTDSAFVSQPNPESPWVVNQTINNHSIYIPDEIAYINSLPISQGDYIGVFYDSLGILVCAGYSVYNGQSIAITAWGADSGNDGFQNNEIFKWKIWRANDNTEWEAQATYNISAFPDSAYFKVNGISGLSSLSAIGFEEQEIELTQGWRIISSFIEPEEKSIDSIFSDVSSNIEIVKNGAGHVYYPQYAVNLIGDWNIADGYQIKANTTDTLIIQGSGISPDTVLIDLTAGWGIISYLHKTQKRIDLMMNSIIPNIEIIKDENGLLFWPVYNVNMIGNMRPGSGYQIKMNQADSLYYPAN